jgi:ABC-type amino acid transport substrate-binding protein
MIRVFLVACMVLMTGPLRAEQLVVGLPEPGRVPFFWHDEAKGFQGTYVELLNRIASMVGFTVEYRMVPQARLIAEYNAGKIDIEPGIAPAWRPGVADQANSRYTGAFMNMEDVLIVPQGAVMPAIAVTEDLVKLNGLRVGQVRGFFVPPGLQVIECVDELTIARKVHAKQWDAGLMNGAVARWYKAQNRFTYEIGAPFASTPVAFRVRVDHERWVVPIDGALEKLRKRGELARILRPKVP